MTYNTVWHCKCDCGNEADVTGVYLLRSPYASCGCVGKRKDLTGQSFGFLTALYPLKVENAHETIWHCRCVCGNERDVPIDKLMVGAAISCGKHKEYVKPDLTGLRFGRLTATELRVEDLKRFWKCECDCGNEIEVEEYRLLHGGPRSCGCVQGKYKDYTGERRGRLTAIRPTGEIRHLSPVYVWRCDCGNEVERSVIQVAKIHENMCDECLRQMKRESFDVVKDALEKVSIDRVAVKTIRDIVAGVPTKANTSGVRGVYWSGKDRKWVARGKKDGKVVHLGLYDDIEDAKRAREIFVEQRYVGDLEKYDREHSVEENEE